MMGQHDAKSCEIPPADLGVPTSGLVGERIRGLTDDLEEPFSLVAAAAGDSSLRRRYERPLWTLLVVVGLVL